MTECSRAKRLAKNTIFLYFRMFIMMAISLYTSRVILNTLGVSDYGIYNVIGGFVAMFTLLSGSLTNAVSRFLTYEIGKSSNHLNLVFSTSLTVMFFLSLIVLLVGETAGYWFLNSKMNIPIDRIVAANWTLQCSLLTFAVNLISVPYNAMIIANEKMLAFTYISIFEAVLKLLIVYLVLLSTCEKLVVYSILLLLVSILIRLLYGVYAKRNFKDSTYHFVYDKQLLKKITNFAGWNFLGSGAAIINIHGVNMLMNLFFGVTVNAARGMAVQVNHAINSFAQNFMTALNPQITKSFAVGDSKYMFTLIFQGARLSFYMLLFLSLPVLMSTEYILSIWLKIVPDYTIIFVRLVLIFAMCESISNPLITAMLATGSIRNYQIVVGGMQMMNFPISYILLERGYAPEITLYVAIGISLCCLALRLFMLRSMIQLPVRSYMKNVFFNICAVTIFSVAIPYLISLRLQSSFYSFLILSFSCIICSFMAIFFVGCKASERVFVVDQVRKLIKNNL